ncbi:hypothetical protein Pint_24218 [Pistacia integerrima]|uniref:Uncharacterized protein n=1 Tax=Pistacia integerrima TaxID=434235 RepID=A0ACC0YDH3_9ROSI|nr:hypothetical protein Pint_24218 [Pistacia integerrima]
MFVAVIKTGLNVILACSIPKNSPMLEVNAEKKLVEKLISSGSESVFFSNPTHNANFLTDTAIRNPKHHPNFLMSSNLIVVTCISSISENNFVAMASRIGLKVHKTEITRSVSETPPTHYTVTIQSFSLLSKNDKKYESAEFEAGGNKWKLVLHPNGNKNKNVANHISLYLAVADASSLPPDWEVSAVYRLFLLDQNKDNYLVAQEPQGKQRRFHRLKPERGFDRFIPTKVFSDASYGYLVDDTCELGAEVFVSKERSRGKAECLEMIKDPGSFKHVWKIENFSMLASEYYDSKEFTAAGFKWKMQLYPKGRDTGAGCISLYLVLADLTSLTPASKVYVDCTLRIQDQVENRHISFKKSHWFSASSRESGWARFFPLSFFLRPNDWVVNDVCFLEAEVTVRGIASTLL